MLLRTPLIDPGEFETRTGWTLRPEGLCKADRCIPLPPEAIRDGGLDAPAVAERLGAPLVHDPDRGLWALGPEGGGRVLESAEAPEITLPDLDGNPFSLSTLAGRKVLLVAWASW